MKQTADSKCRESLARKPNEKLAPRFYGPFEILQQIGQVAYRLKLPSTSKIHDVFHVSKLKKAVGKHTDFSTIPSNLSPNMELLVEPLEVRCVRSSDHTGKAGTEVLIRWKGLPAFEDSWEQFVVILKQFPQFNLEDKVRVWVAGNVRPPTHITYARRKKQ
ncbi:uncharacterized protein LOC141710938 [Apium graveolens]|uniref:uncharacterized protein LOC141710938 n=1 Tax=Apium graveolens TaxID=4045 RepID=UPI003D7A946A